MVLGINTAAIKKINDRKDLFSGYSNPKVEHASNIDVNGSTNVQLAFEEYKEHCTLRCGPFHNEKSELILTPNEIELFSMYYIPNESDILIEKAYGPLYISKLIQNSFNEGNNNFRLRRYDEIKEYALLADLAGKKDRMINVDVYSNVTSEFCLGAKYVNVNIHGDGGSLLGNQSKNCSIYVKNNAKSQVGVMSENLKVIIGGDVSGMIGERSFHIDASVKGSLKHGIGTCSNEGKYALYGDMIYLNCSRGDLNQITIYKKEVLESLLEKTFHKERGTNRVFDKNGEMVLRFR